MCVKITTDSRDNVQTDPEVIDIPTKQQALSLRQSIGILMGALSFFICSGFTKIWEVPT
jgi:hypothetical protein